MIDFTISRELLEALKDYLFFNAQLSQGMAAGYCEAWQQGIKTEMRYYMQFLTLNDVPLAVINAARGIGSDADQISTRGIIAAVNAAGCGYCLNVK